MRKTDQKSEAMDQLCRKYGSEFVGEQWANFMDGQELQFDNQEQQKDFYLLFVGNGFHVVDVIGTFNIRKAHI